MINSLDLNFDGVFASDLNVTKITTGSGLVEETFISSITNNTVKPRNAIKSLYQEDEREPLDFPVVLFFEENLNDTTIREVKKWLYKDDYRPLYFGEQSDRVVFAKLDGDIKLSHNSIDSGYISLTFKTNSEFWFSQEHVYEGLSTSTSTTITVLNMGDSIVYPKFEFILDGTASDIQVTNVTTGETMLIENNLTSETITVYGEYEELDTSSNLRTLYDDHNEVFPYLELGFNELTMTGDFQYKITYREIYL